MLLVLPVAFVVASSHSYRNGSGAIAARMDKESADLDVAIVGGGPGGLATAAAILSALGEHTRVQASPRHDSINVASLDF